MSAGLPLSYRRPLFWLAVGAAILAFFWLLSPVLFPFLAGLAIAYLLDPVVDRVERAGLSRAWSTSLVTAAFFIILAVSVVLLAPVLYEQLVGLAAKLSDSANRLFRLFRPYIETLLEQRGGGEGGGSSGVSIATEALGWATGLIARLWTGGLAVFNVLSLVFITPVVAFYLLRDWDRIVATIELWLPRDHAAVIRQLLGEIDERMSGFLRGQALVCLMLGVFYAAGLSLLGLSYGLIIGLITGLLSFIPYIGMIAGAGIGLAVALFQYESWLMIGAVAGVFLLGQVIEGNFVSPVLVGDRVGLHPVWIMLAILAGGALFGFIGVLVAVPAAAAMAVLLKFGIGRYLQSDLYRGRADPAPALRESDEP